MADTVAITAGAGTSIATDDAGAGGHVQIVKLAIAADGSATVLPGDATDGLLVNLGANNDVTIASLPALAAGTNNIGDVDVLTLPALSAGTNNIGDVDVLTLPAIPAGTNLIGAVNLRPHAATVTAASSGLTTAATAYTAGDTVGAIRTASSCARVSGGTGIIRGIYVHDKNDVTSLLTVFIFRATVTLAADNAAWSVSDADMDSLVWRGQIAMTDEGNQRVGLATPYAPFDCNASDLFIAVRTETAHNQFAAVTDLPIKLWIVQD